MKPYTKEPWHSQWADNGMLRIVEQSDEAAIIADVNVERQEITGRPEEEGIANGRRIVACVNACKGVTTEELEELGIGAVGRACQTGKEIESVITKGWQAKQDAEHEEEDRDPHLY